MRPWLLVLSLVIACHGGHDGGDGGATVDAVSPNATCDIPAGGGVIDTSASTNVVGTGTGSSCTAAALQAAVAAGGLVRFNCGAAPVTITLGGPILINNTAGSDGLGDTVIDGAGTVTLKGAGKSRLITLDACTAPVNSPHCDTFPHPALTLERLKLVGGADTGSDGGGAVLRKGGSLTVIDSEFLGNSCAKSGQDVAGGAIRLLQATPALIVHSVFRSNTCSNGGAIGSLQASPVTIVNSSFTGNSATGSGGNPGNGGNAGAIYHDGTSLDLKMCGVTIATNTANAYGGGMFFVDDAGSGTIDIENTEITGNTIPVVTGSPSHGGAAYLQGAAVTLSNVTIANDSAGFAAGLYVNSMSGHGSLDATNVTISDIQGTALTAEGGVGGNLFACTLAGNTLALSGAGGFTMTTSALGSNAMGCDAAPVDGGGNVQFPDATCGAAVPVLDPELGALADNGGSTGVTTRAPAPGSPAIGAGSACPVSDARGLRRPVTACTSGAYESAAD